MVACDILIETGKIFTILISLLLNIMSLVYIDLKIIEIGCMIILSAVYYCVLFLYSIIFYKLPERIDDSISYSFVNTLNSMRTRFIRKFLIICTFFVVAGQYIILWQFENKVKESFILYYVFFYDYFAVSIFTTYVLKHEIQSLIFCSKNVFIQDNRMALSDSDCLVYRILVVETNSPI